MDERLPRHRLPSNIIYKSYGELPTPSNFIVTWHDAEHVSVRVPGAGGQSVIWQDKVEVTLY